MAPSVISTNGAAQTVRQERRTGDCMSTVGVGVSAPRAERERRAPLLRGEGGTRAVHQCGRVLPPRGDGSGKELWKGWASAERGADECASAEWVSV